MNCNCLSSFALSAHAKKFAYETIAVAIRYVNVDAVFVLFFPLLSMRSMMLDKRVACDKKIRI